ncbi:MAG: hypothetical protein AAF638_10280 [Pseudomonadota bacterium]
MRSIQQQEQSQIGRPSGCNSRFASLHRCVKHRAPAGKLGQFAKRPIFGQENFSPTKRFGSPQLQGSDGYIKICYRFCHILPAELANSVSAAQNMRPQGIELATYFVFYLSHRLAPNHVAPTRHAPKVVSFNRKIKVKTFCSAQWK